MKPGWRTKMYHKVTPIVRAWLAIQPIRFVLWILVGMEGAIARASQPAPATNVIQFKRRRLTLYFCTRARATSQPE